MDSSLLTILLVVCSTGGHHFLFNYPPNPRRPIASTSNRNYKSPFSPSSLQKRSSSPCPDARDYPPATKENILNFDTEFLAGALAPKLPLCDGKFQLSIDELTFVGHPVSLSSGKSSSPSTSNGSSSTAEEHKSHMTLFHVVFVLSPPDLELYAQVDALYTHVVRRYTAALQYEQLRCGYIQDEFDKILTIRENANKGLPYEDLIQDILRESSLARDIKQIYTALSTDSIAHIIINDFIDLSLQIPVFGESSMGSTQRAQDSHYASLMDIYGVSGYEYDNYPVICPYHTLLLLEDPEEVLKNMPLDASPTLVQLVQILTPTQSLQELHLVLDCSLAQIYRLAAHLIYWRKAKLIHTIHARNIYVVSPQAKLEDLASLNADFKMHVAVPNLDLPRLLSQLSIAKPLHVIASKEFRNQYLEAITYLVRKDLVVQLHMFLVLVDPTAREDDTTALSRRSSSNSSNMANNASPPPHSAEGIPSSSSPGMAERQRLRRFIHDKAPKEITDLFERLVPYMDGKHHIEEIMYREGVSRKQLNLVLKYYRDNIVTVYHY
ncbi:UPF0171-domain-containing protein [Lichtheimia hyalospora FSU 10163]|nr:UPF0171-domain-containing protein [Lichtheimia hyalospora FSU 10163]